MGFSFTIKKPHKTQKTPLLLAISLWKANTAQQALLSSIFVHIGKAGIYMYMSNTADMYTQHAYVFSIL